MLAATIELAAGATHAEEDRYAGLIAGYEHTSGTYGTASTTDIVTIPVSAFYTTGPWSLKLTVPYLQVTGDGEVIASGGYRGKGANSSTTTTIGRQRTTQSGLGDVVSMLTYNLYSGEEQVSGIDLSGRVKFGTASTALGTGQNDYAVQMFAYRGIGDFVPNVMFGYEVLGSSPQLVLNNVYYGAVGSSYNFSAKTSMGVEYKYVQKPSAILSEQRQATLYASRQIGSGVYLRGYLLKGYAAGSPDSGFGFMVSSMF